MPSSAEIVLAPQSEAFSFVWTAESIERELSEELSFLVPGAQYMQRFRRGWDGRISLFNRTTKLVYAGLIPRILRWAHTRGYAVENRVTMPTTSWSSMDTEQLIASYPVALDIRDYQKAAITHGLHHPRCVLLSPTASGKSLVLYYLVRERMRHGPVLLIVPTITLVRQMVEDWRGYGWTDVDASVHQIIGGVTKHTTKPVVVSTWQSIFRQPEDWFSRYTTLLGDEAHTFKAESLRSIMEKLPHCTYRIGVTGTLDDAKSHKLMVEGVFGEPFRVARTVDLQQQGHLTPIRIQGHVLQYGDADKETLREHKRLYAEEIDFLVQHPERMTWLVNFVEQLTGNVLVLYQFVEKHGIPLYRAVCERIGGRRPVYFVSGGVSADARETIRALLEHSEHIVLTFGTTVIRCVPSEPVPLTSGETKMAEEITCDDDVDDGWILNRSSKEMPTLISPRPNS